MFILSERLSNSLLGSDVLLISEFINILSILTYDLIEFIILFYTFLLLIFARYKKNMIYLISFDNFSVALPAFTYASAIGNLPRICLGFNIFSRIAKFEGRPFPIFLLLEIFHLHYQKYSISFFYPSFLLILVYIYIYIYIYHILFICLFLNFSPWLMTKSH